MEDKRKINLLLRAVKRGIVDQDYAVNYILDIYTYSKRFNVNSFFIGVSISSISFLVYINYFIE